RPAGAPDLHHVTGGGLVEVPLGVGRGQVEASVRGVGVALGPHGRRHGVEVDAVVGDADAVGDGRTVAGRQWQSVGRGIHEHGAGLVEHRVGAGLRPEVHGHVSVGGTDVLYYLGGQCLVV